MAKAKAAYDDRHGRLQELLARLKVWEWVGWGCVMGATEKRYMARNILLQGKWVVGCKAPPAADGSTELIWYVTASPHGPCAHSTSLLQECDAEIATANKERDTLEGRRADLVVEKKKLGNK